MNENKEKRLTNKEATLLAYKIAEMIMEKTDSGEQSFFVLNTAVSLVLGNSFRISRDANL